MRHESDESESAKSHDKTNFPVEETVSVETISNSDKKGGNSHHNFQKHTVTAIREVINTQILE